MTLQKNIPLMLSSKDYMSTEHYFAGQVAEWIEKQQQKHITMEKELKSLFPELKLNRIIEDRRGNKVVVETKSL